jgi:hypothetical protein
MIFELQVREPTLFTTTHLRLACMIKVVFQLQYLAITKRQEKVRPLDRARPQRNLETRSVAVMRQWHCPGVE